MQESLNFHRRFDRKCTVSLKHLLISRPKGRFSCFKAEHKKDKSRQEEWEGDNGYLMQKTWDCKCGEVTKRTDPWKEQGGGLPFYVPCCSDVCFTGVMCSNQRDKLLIGSALDRSNVSLFPEDKSKKQERNLHRIPSFCTAKYHLDDITQEKVTVNLFLP